jgi:hypothetical protein
MDSWESLREEFREELADALVRTRRQAILIERLGTELHALLLVLLQKKILTLAEVRAAERRLDLAATMARATEFEAVVEDVDRLDAELDAERDRRRRRVWRPSGGLAGRGFRSRPSARARRRAGREGEGRRGSPSRLYRGSHPDENAWADRPRGLGGRPGRRP